MTMMNPYKVLNLQPGATDKEITKAYRALALRYHPDKRKAAANDAAAADEMFQKCKDAYQMLMDPQRRAEVDLRLAGEEERRRRVAAMDARRRQLQQDLLERERAVASQKSVSSNKAATAGAKNNTATATATTENTKQPTFPQPKLPQFALLLKVKNFFATVDSPLPLNATTAAAAAAASLNLPESSVHLLDGNQLVAEFGDAVSAAAVLERLPFDAFKSGDWFLGVPPAELYRHERKADSATVRPDAKKQKLTPHFEADVLKRLREAAATASKKNQNQSH